MFFCPGFPFGNSSCIVFWEIVAKNSECNTVQGDTVDGRNPGNHLGFIKACK